MATRKALVDNPSRQKSANCSLLNSSKPSRLILSPSRTHFIFELGIEKITKPSGKKEKANEQPSSIFNGGTLITSSWRSANGITNEELQIFLQFGNFAWNCVRKEANYGLCGGLILVEWGVHRSKQDFF